ncbi:MAG: hypothetical protein AB8B87_02075 [Granulosicoccus sp.]
MILNKNFRQCAVPILGGITLLHSMAAQSAGEGWSAVPYAGFSLLGDKSPTIVGANEIDDGSPDAAVDAGFTAGLSLRYEYTDSPWASEIGWEYRSNDAETTTADGVVLPDGNYAPNIFSLNERYSLTQGDRVTPWFGGGLTWVQELDLDSENTDGERLFSD